MLRRNFFALSFWLELSREDGTAVRWTGFHFAISGAVVSCLCRGLRGEARNDPRRGPAAVRPGRDAQSELACLFQKVKETLLGHPLRPFEVGLDGLQGPLGLLVRLDAENEPRHLDTARALLLGVEEP